MSEPQKGVLAMLGACIIWGLSPLYYKLLSHVPAPEVLSHRTLWSVVFFMALLLVQGRLGAVRPLLWGRAGLVTALAALMMSLNWFFFIYSVQQGHVVEASLGFYIFPLAAVAIGVLGFAERLRAGQVLSILLALAAVVTLAVGLGVTPWIALVLAATLALYGATKRFVQAGPVISVAAEVMMVLPLAFLWLGLAHTGNAPISTGQAGQFGQDWQTSGLLVLSGIMTAIPLILFSYATRRVSMTSIGLIQYLNPTLQFFCAVLVFSESFTLWHKIAFPLIWTALAVYSVEALWRERSLRRAKRQAVVPVIPAP